MDLVIKEDQDIQYSYGRSRRAECARRKKHRTRVGCNEFRFPVYSAKAWRECLAATAMLAPIATHAVSRDAGGPAKDRHTR